MRRYSCRQPASFFGLAVIVTALLYSLYMAVILPHPITIFVAGILVLVLALFSSLEVSVDSSTLRLSYGIGLINLNFPLGDIVSVKTVRNKWWYGWGIHLTPHGWLFNVAGLEAVELTMTSGKTYRVGTAEPESLARVIRSHEAVLAFNSGRGENTAFHSTTKNAG